MADFPRRDLLSLQGEIRMAFIQAGLDAGKALELASEALHIVAESPVATPDHRAAYQKVLGGSGRSFGS